METESNTAPPMDFLFDNASMPVIEWLAEQMPGGFFIYGADESHEIIFINRAACRIFGCNTVDEFKELTGNTFDGMVHPDDFATIQASIDEQIAKDEENQLDHVIYRIVRKDEEIRWVDDYGHLAEMPGYGNVYYVFISDITVKKRMEEQIERNYKLEKALEESEEANVAKTAFLSNLSHEIRTPITAILGMNDIICRETKDDSILNYTTNIRKAATSLLGIISDILDFSKIEDGKLELVPTNYSIAEIVGDLYNIIQFKAEEKGLALQLEVDPKLPSVMIGDDLRIKQIITNLLTNAVKYTEKGSVKLRISLKGEVTENARILVVVSDTGIGIKEEEMDKLFVAFDRLDVKRTHTIEGAGLGLPICRQLLRLMDSDLYVKSKYDEGSAFYFELDQKVADKEPIGDFSLKQHTVVKDSQNISSFAFTAPESRILIVDDTPMNLEVIEGLLKPTQMQIDTAQSGAECIEKFAIYPYDLIFLDYRMPRLDGIETLEEMKERDPAKFEQTPIISLTASAVTGERERMLNAGFTDYLTKPINISDMQEMLMKYLPDEEITITESDREASEENPYEGIPKEAFELSWLDPKEGVEYCGSANMYMRALEIFTKGIDDKADLIEKCVKEKDIKLYTINVHALKSTSLTIGAEKFSARARELELAGKRDDWAMIEKETPEFLKAYRALKPDLMKVLEK